MKKILRFILRAILLIFVVVILFVQYLKSELNNAFDSTSLNELKKEISNAESIPEDFMEVHRQINPIRNTSRTIFNRIVENSHYECPCLNVARAGFIRSKNRFTGNAFVLSWKLEKEFTQEQCFDYYAANYDFGYGTNGLKSAAEYYFKKEISNLTHKEKATLVIMFENSVLYNPINRPERINQKLKELGIAEPK